MTTFRTPFALLALVLILTACGRDQLSHGGDTVAQESETTTQNTEAEVEDTTPPATSVAEAASSSSTNPYDNWRPFVVPDGGVDASTTTDESTTTSSTTTTTTEPEPVPVWQDLPDPATMQIVTQDPDGMLAGFSGATQRTSNGNAWWDVAGPDVAVIGGAGPCELGTTWVMGHSHDTSVNGGSKGATVPMVIHPTDSADEQYRQRGFVGIQVGDRITITLVDGRTCTYEVRPFPVPRADTEHPFTGMPAESVGPTPAMAWPKLRFCEDMPDMADLLSANPSQSVASYHAPLQEGTPLYEWYLSRINPTSEWYQPGSPAAANFDVTDESVMYLSTSGGDRGTKCHAKTGRLNADTVYTVLIASDIPMVYADQ